MTLTYMSGFGNDFETESLPGALPVGRNSPQKCPYGLYAEQISGSPFTAPRDSNQRSWLYRIRPSVLHSGRFVKAEQGLWRTAPCAEYEMPPGQLRWSPTPIPDEPLTLVQGIRTMTTAGDAGAQAGLGAHIYLITASMQDEYLCNADGEMLFALQQGALRFVTELGVIEATPGEIAVIPRGMKMRVELVDGGPCGLLDLGCAVYDVDQSARIPTHPRRHHPRERGGVVERRPGRTFLGPDRRHPKQGDSGQAKGERVGVGIVSVPDRSERTLGIEVRARAANDLPNLRVAHLGCPLARLDPRRAVHGDRIVVVEAERHHAGPFLLHR
jgi:hypothetical protein